MLDCQIYGLNPAGHHATNVLFHTANSILVFLLLRRMTGAQWRSAFVAALFALHPLHVESVAWVSERKDVLSTFFWALTIWAYVRYARKRSGAEDRKVGPCCARPDTRSVSLPGSQQQVSGACFPPALLRGLWTLDYGLVLLFFTLGLLSKPMLVTLPFLLLLLDFWPLNRVSGVRSLGSGGSDQLSGGETPEEKHSTSDSPLTTHNSQLITLLGLIVEKLPLLVLSGLCSAATLWSQGFAVGVLHQPFYVRLENAFQSSFGYMLKMAWPAKLVVLYPFTPDFVAWQLGLAVLVVGGLSVLAVRHAKKLPYLFTGWFWFLGTLVPVIGLVQVGLQSMADRYTYVPLIGLFIVIAWGGHELARRWQLRFGVLAALAILLVLACIPVTRAQLAYWKDSVTLLEHALRWTADNYVAENNLALALLNDGQLEAARKHLSKAVRIRPGYADALNNLGLIAGMQGDADQEMALYRAAVQKQPNDPKFHHNLACALVRKSQWDQAIQEFETALRLNHDASQSRADLARALTLQGRLADARAQWIILLRREPDNLDGHMSLGLLLTAETNSMAEALRHFSEAARINPTNALVRAHLAITFEKTGATEQAVGQYLAAIRLDSGMPVVLNNLAWILASYPDAAIRNGAEAVRLAERACQLTEYQDATMISTLGAAYAEAGRFEQAVEMARKAETLAASAGNQGFAERNEKMAQLFLARQPFHTTPASANFTPPGRKP
jgi:Flp pilus assembly protein TadD